LRDYALVMVMGRCRYFKSVSVFRYTGRYFCQVGSVFVVGISKYRDIGSVFSVFHFESKRHVLILRFCFRVSPQMLTEDPCQRSCRWQKLAPLSGQAPTYRWQRVGVNLAHWMRRAQKN